MFPFPSSFIVIVTEVLSSVKVTDFGLILSPYKFRGILNIDADWCNSLIENLLVSK